MGISVIGEGKSTYNVTVADRQGGNYTQSIESKGRLTTVICESEVHIHVKVLFVRRDHDYSYKGKEVWKDDKLVSLESDTNDNGEIRSTRISGDKAEGINWSTSYWFLPKTLIGQPMKIVDSDTGVIYDGKLVSLGKDGIGNRYRLEGLPNKPGSYPPITDLWYSDEGKLERREMMRKGYRTVVQKYQTE